MNKGDIIFVGGIWYIVTKDNGKYISCICDHANNIHGWEHQSVDLKLTAREAMRFHGWREYPDHLDEEKVMKITDERAIPVTVIAEVLSGCHDDR